MYEKFGSSERREEHKTASREDRKRPKSFREQNITFHIITPTPFILLPQDKEEESTHRDQKMSYMEKTRKLKIIVRKGS